MSIDREIKIFSEFMQDCERGVKTPRHANTEDLFMAMRRLAIEYMHTDKAAIALQRIESQERGKFVCPQCFDSCNGYGNGCGCKVQP